MSDYNLKEAEVALNNSMGVGRGDPYKAISDLEAYLLRVLEESELLSGYLKYATIKLVIKSSKPTAIVELKDRMYRGCREIELPIEYDVGANLMVGVSLDEAHVCILGDLLAKRRDALVVVSEGVGAAIHEMELESRAQNS